VPSGEGEFDLFLSALGGALVLALLSWVLYVAIEPYARRLWPRALVSWSRLLAGRFRDPLVGRDVLIGSLFGVAFIGLTGVGALLPRWLGLPPPAPLLYGIDTLAGGRQALGSLFTVQLISLSVPLAHIVLFLLLRILLRKQSAAAVVYALILGVFGAMKWGPIGGEAVSVSLMAFGAALSLVSAVVLLTLLMRFGVLSLAACFLVANLMANFPVTLDTTAHYFPTSVFALLVAGALAAYAFYTSLAGQALFQDAIFGEHGAEREPAR
jgi:serine/threonine-protein kinase